MKNRFTTPKVKSYPIESGKDWYVWFRFNNGNPIRIKEGINKIPDFNERLENANILAEILHEKLIKGWIPIKQKAVITKDSLTLSQAIDFGLEKKKASISEETYKDYRNMVNWFKNAAEKLEINLIPISTCERYHVKLIMEHLHKEKKWTNKNFNKNLGYIKPIFSELVEWEYIKTNFVRDIRSKKEIKTEGYIRPTLEQKQKIFEHLKSIDYNYFVFAAIEYYLGIRPKEILLIKCCDIDLHNRTIKISPEDSKDASYRYVPILKPVLDLLLKMDLSNPNFYLIGRPKPFGCRFFKHEYFCPNPYPIKRDTATRKWKEYIIDGLGINVKCYSLKHDGANAKLKAGMDLKTISRMFGHSDEKITEIYANHINEIMFDEAQNIELDIY